MKWLLNYGLGWWRKLVFVWVILHSRLDLLISKFKGFGSSKEGKFFGIVLSWLSYGNYDWKQMLVFFTIRAEM